MARAGNPFRSDAFRRGQPRFVTLIALRGMANTQIVLRHQLASTLHSVGVSAFAALIKAVPVHIWRTAQVGARTGNARSDIRKLPAVSTPSDMRVTLDDLLRVGEFEVRRDQPAKVGLVIGRRCIRSDREVSHLESWSDGIFTSLRVDAADVHPSVISPRNDEACEWT